ncbi:MAG: SCO family protein [Pseudomonadota bacterium]
MPLPRPLLYSTIITVLCLLTLPAAQAHNGAAGLEATRVQGGDFNLQSAGGPVRLSDFQGKVVAIYFGYTHCEDTCPITLGKLGSALKLLKPEEAEQIQPIFITIDPARDDAQRLASYSTAFYPGLIGLTGSASEIAAAARAYGINYRKGPVSAKGGYDFSLPSVIYLVGRDGKLLRSRPHGNSPALIAAALRKALLNH